MIDASGKLFGKINVVDAVIGGVVLLAAVGILAVQSGWYTTSSQVVKGETDIRYAVWLRNVKTLRPQLLFKPGEELSMTIRNQPRGKVKIDSVNLKPKQLLVPKKDGDFVLIQDPDDAYGFDYLLVLRDHATITDDGYVTNGVKVKIGSTVVVEGFDYRLSGIIAEVQEYKEEPLQTLPPPADRLNGQSTDKPGALKGQPATPSQPSQQRKS